MLVRPCHEEHAIIQLLPALMMMHDDSYDDACMMMQLQVRYVRTRTVTQVAPIQDFGVYVVASSHLLHAGGRICFTPDRIFHLSQQPNAKNIYWLDHG